MRKLILLLLLLPFLAGSCGNKEDNTDITKELDKTGSVETAIAINLLPDGQHELVSTNRIWVKGSLFKESVHRDTIPNLGTEMATAENDDEEKTVPVPRQYEVYVTVK